MKIRALCVLVFAALAAPSAPAAAEGKLEFTLIGNMSFHITDGETTLLSDFPYKSGAYGYMAYDAAKIPPIKDGLAVITHFHTDHWSKELFEKTDFHIIAPKGVLEMIESPREIPATGGQTASFKNIRVTPHETPHRFSPQHFSYLVEWHGLRLYFCGDTETPEHILQMKDLDVLFISPWLIRTLERQKLPVPAKKLVVYHQKVGEEIPPYQDYLRFDAQGGKFEVEFPVSAKAK